MSGDSPAPGTLYGVGLGPGDPELVTVRGARVIAEADVVAFHAARHGNSIARDTAAAYMRGDQLEELLVYPLTVEETDHPGGYEAAIEEFYAEAAQRLAAHLRAGRDVALCAAGDPLFYSSFMHMYTRLCDEFSCEIVPGVTAVSAVSAAVTRPLVEGEEVLTVLPGTLDEATLTERLAQTDSAVVMKLGRTFAKVRRAVAAAGRLDEARYVERATWPAQRVEPLADVDADTVPYFSAAVIPSPEDTRRRVAGVPAGSAGHDEAPRLVVIGTGPGPAGWRTPEVDAALRTATDVVGYATYTRRVPPRPGQRIHSSDNRVEVERATFALDLARAGRRVVVVSGGDPGVFAMASAVFEAAEAGGYADVEIEVLPGVTAASAVAARAGAPLGHDFAMISLSDRLKPWEVVEARLRALLSADLAVAVYNPASRSRREQVVRLRDVALEVGGSDRVVIVGRDVGGAEESLTVTTAAAFDPDVVDMRTLLIVGSSRTRVLDTAAGPRAYTPRSY
ncbi:precorrin-3B C(17)-methyltransferase [Dietzia sp. 179-F 9C3 NHS]|uniref:precorrin-3B C(17)-methyltransferase n=1 Tax=Dietzia sp. 179-F 9C3 NHS TaxID=3374295 RepID=UPI00387A1F2E